MFCLLTARNLGPQPEPLEGGGPRRRKWGHVIGAWHWRAQWRPWTLPLSLSFPSTLRWAALLPHTPTISPHARLADPSSHSLQPLKPRAETNLSSHKLLFSGILPQRQEANTSGDGEVSLLNSLVSRRCTILTLWIFLKHLSHFLLKNYANY